MVKNIDTFKKGKMDEKTITQIVNTAGWAHTLKGKWVFKEGDNGEELFIVLHGKCLALKANNDYLESRRALREKVKTLFD